MSWRPDDWDDIWENTDNTCATWQVTRDVFEAGADAILKSLIAKGVHYGESNTLTGQKYTIWVDTGKPGTWVFIPDGGADDKIPR